MVMITTLLSTPTASAASSHKPANCAKLQPRRELHCAWKQLTQARHALRCHCTPHHSAAYWRWRKRVAKRWIKAAHYRISHPPIKHEKLWVCIHNHEGAWNDDTGNGYYGGLQMTENWGPYGTPLVYHANTMSPYGQMAVAEHGYQIVIQHQGYSYARYTWLPGQWYHPDCLAYAA